VLDGYQGCTWLGKPTPHRHVMASSREVLVASETESVNAAVAPPSTVTPSPPRVTKSPQVTVGKDHKAQGRNVVYEGSQTDEERDSQSQHHTASR
jgi:hypothetical protein